MNLDDPFYGGETLPARAERLDLSTGDLSTGEGVTVRPLARPSQTKSWISGMVWLPTTGTVSGPCLLTTIDPRTSTRSSATIHPGKSWPTADEPTIEFQIVCCLE